VSGVKVSLVSTLLQEGQGIAEFLESIRLQTRRPDEVILTDGGSTDGTVDIIHGYKTELPLQLIVLPGCNRSQGRNAAIKRATGDVIAVTDAGCRLAPAWLEKITAPIERGASVVAGYYEADARSLRERAVAAATIPLVREVKPDVFLPSSRSLAFRKEAWEKVGGYPEDLGHNEDTAFSRELRGTGGAFVFQPDAVVYWRPRRSLGSLFVQFYRYAVGDGECGFWFPHYAKAYLVGTVFVALAAVGAVQWEAWLVLGALALLYCMRYAVRSRRRGAGYIASVFSVPAMITVDIAHLFGYTFGRLRDTYNRVRDIFARGQ